MQPQQEKTSKQHGGRADPSTHASSGSRFSGGHTSVFVSAVLIIASCFAQRHSLYWETMETPCTHHQLLN